MRHHISEHGTAQKNQDRAHGKRGKVFVAFLGGELRRKNFAKNDFLVTKRALRIHAAMLWRVGHFTAAMWAVVGNCAAHNPVWFPDFYQSIGKIQYQTVGKIYWRLWAENPTNAATDTGHG